MSEAIATPAPATATAIDAVAIAAPKAAPQATTDTPQTAPAKAEAPKPAEPEYWEVPVDGKKVRMTRDEVLKEASLSRAANKRFEDAAAMRKQAEGLLEHLRDPRKAIKLLQDPKLGLNPDEVRSAFEEWYAGEVMPRDAMTPEQKRLADAEAKIAKWEEEKAEQAKAKEAEEANSRDAATIQEVQKEIIKTLEESGLPKSKFTVNRIAYWTQVNESKGLNAPRELIIKQVRKELREVVDSVVSASDGDMLFDVLGDSTVKKIRSHDLAKIRARRQQAMKPPTPVEAEGVPRETTRITEDEVNRRMRDLWKT